MAVAGYFPVDPAFFPTYCAGKCTSNNFLRVDLDCTSVPVSQATNKCFVVPKDTTQSIFSVLSVLSDFYLAPGTHVQGRLGCGSTFCICPNPWDYADYCAIVDAGYAVVGAGYQLASVQKLATAQRCGAGVNLMRGDTVYTQVDVLFARFPEASPGPFYTVSKISTTADTNFALGCAHLCIAKGG